MKIGAGSMDNESAKWLYDALEAARLVRSFVEGKDFAEYEADALLKSGVERQFEIVGEALKRVRITASLE